MMFIKCLEYYIHNKVLIKVGSCLPFKFIITLLFLWGGCHMEHISYYKLLQLLFWEVGRDINDKYKIEVRCQNIQPTHRKDRGHRSVRDEFGDIAEM